MLSSSPRRPRRYVAALLVVASAALLTGCPTSRTPTSYGDKVETAFMDGCTKRLVDDQAKSETSVGKPIDVCRCAYDALTADKGGVKFDRIKAVNDDLTEKPGPLPKDLAEVVADCG